MVSGIAFLPLSRPFVSIVGGASGPVAARVVATVAGGVVCLASFFRFLLVLSSLGWVSLRSLVFQLSLCLLGVPGTWDRARVRPLRP